MAANSHPFSTESPKLRIDRPTIDGTQAATVMREPSKPNIAPVLYVPANVRDREFIMSWRIRPRNMAGDTVKVWSVNILTSTGVLGMGAPLLAGLTMYMRWE
jgi:hypothetical protein